MTSIGAEITLSGDGRGVLEAPVGSAFLQQQGFAHGGLLFTLADTAAGYAALTMMPPEVEVMTLEMKLNLMAPASGRLRAEGRVLKAGRGMSFVAADVWSEDHAEKVGQVADDPRTMTPVDRAPEASYLGLSILNT